MNVNSSTGNSYRTMAASLKPSSDQGMITMTSPSRETKAATGCHNVPKRKGFRFGKNNTDSNDASSFPAIIDSQPKNKGIVRALFRSGGSSSSVVNSRQHVEQFSSSDQVCDMEVDSIECSNFLRRRPQHESEEHQTSPTHSITLAREPSYEGANREDMVINTINDLLENGARQLRSDRSAEGLCPSCGTRLFEISYRRKRISGFFHNSNADTERRVALNIAGIVENGTCLNCLDTSNNSSNNLEANHNNDNAAAVIASAMMLDNRGKSVDQGISSNNIGTTLQEEIIVPPSIVIPDIAEVPVPPPLVSQVMPIYQENFSLTCSAIYKGSFNSFGERHGKGEMSWSNGDRFEGDFSHEQRNGHGILTFADGGKYVGGWKDDKMHGMNCTRSFPNGDYYMGDYCNGERHGHGSFYFANGDAYVGFLEHSKFQGFGRYYNSKTGTCFEGIFCQDQRQGKGKFQFADGRIDVSVYHENKPTGVGVRWNGSRKKAWKLVNGKVSQRVSLNQAAELARAHNLL